MYGLIRKDVSWGPSPKQRIDGILQGVGKSLEEEISCALHRNLWRGGGGGGGLTKTSLRIASK